MKGTWQTTSDSGGHAAAVAVVVVAVLVAAIAGPVVHAAEDLARMVLIAAAVLIGLTAAGAIGFVAWRARSSRLDRTTDVSFITPAQMRAVQARSAPQQALPAAEVHHHIHLHGLTDDQLAEIINRKDIP